MRAVHGVAVFFRVAGFASASEIAGWVDIVAPPARGVTWQGLARHKKSDFEDAYFCVLHTKETLTEKRGRARDPKGAPSPLGSGD